MRTANYQIFVLLFFCFSTISFSAENQTPPKTKKFVVVLDAGHGGKDSGNTGNGHLEKNIALSIVLKVGEQLKKHNNIEVVYTRTKDVFVPLDKRAEIANNANADLFVSVHCNAHSSNAYGTETFVLGLHRSKDNLEVAMRENSVIYMEDDYESTYDGFDPNSPESYISLTLMQEEYLDQSILLADFVQKEFTNTLKRQNRGVKQAGFLVLRETYMPSVLIETGFLTNSSEGSYLQSKSGQEKMAKAIVEGVNSYKHNINLDLSEPNTTTETEVYEDINFRVQVAAGSKPLEPKPYNFKGLENIERKKEGNLYKYYYGKTSDYLKIQELQQQVKEKGYEQCYIVAFKNGKKTSVNEALKTNMK